jgi:hypothetical protein
MYYRTAKEMVRYFVPSYWGAIRTAYSLVVSEQSGFWSRRVPSLVEYVHNNTLLLNDCDWFARYYHDEYENETQNIHDLLLYEPVENEDPYLRGDFFVG